MLSRNFWLFVIIVLVVEPLRHIGTYTIYTYRSVAQISHRSINFGNYFSFIKIFRINDR
jgi:hypothetical protein